MVLDYWRKKRLIVKLILGAMVLFLVPVGLISHLSFRHLRTIKEVSLQEARSTLINSQVDFLKTHLAQKAKKISTEFSDIKNEIRLLSSMSAAIIQNPSLFTYRNGSQYRLDEGGDYINPVDDGNSSLYVPSRVPSLDSLIPVMENYDIESSEIFVPGYSASLDSLITATESLEIVLKPLVDNEPRVVLGWFIHKDRLSRTYPWRDFKHFPKYTEVTSWPFYYLADPEHNPSGEEVFTQVYTDPLSRHNMISCLSPVFLDDEHVATVGFDITVETLLREISQVHLSEGSSSLLLSRGELLAFSKNIPFAALGLDTPNPYGRTLTLDHLSETGKAVMKPRPGNIGVDFIETDELRAFVGYAELAPLGWRLLLLVPESDILGPANEKAQAIFSETERIRSNFVHLLVIALLAVAGLGYVVVAHQSRGLRTLLAGIRDFGDGKLSRKMPEEGGEFGQLAQALNSMAESLREKKAELEKMYVEIEQGRKLKAVGRLASGVAHEVNNPLATISTYTQMLLRRPDLPDEASDSLHRVMTEIERIQEKLRNLLDLSRLQSFVKSRLDPNELVYDVVEMISHEAHAHGVDLQLTLDDNPRECNLDQSGFKQVLWNLLGNAIAAQNEGGVVRVRTRYIDAPDGFSLFILDVEDEGPGIPGEVLPHIFDPFFTTKEVGKGTGLGLAVVNSIVEGHRGKIEVENLDPAGCRFRILIPEGETE